MSESKAGTGEGRRVPVWDLPVRLFHWVLVALVVTSFVTAKLGGNLMQWHMWSGYSILTLVLFRVLWGFAGSTHARFATFVRGPSAVIGYACALVAGRSERHLGHNPLGGWSVLALLASLAVQAGTGLFANDDIVTEGPLVRLISKDTSDFITRIHNWNELVLYALVGLHLAAIIFYAVVKRENLVGPMITGHKSAAPGEPVSEPVMRGAWQAAVLLAGCAALVWLVVTKA